MISTALILGIMGSLHCIGMCGPIAFMLPLDRSNSWKQWGQLGLYHVGRLLAYGLIGLIFGLIGRGLYLFGFQQKISIAMGVIMIVAVLFPSRISRKWRVLQPMYRVLGKLQAALGKRLKENSADAFLSIGFLNGFLPCGLVYIALIGAMAMATAASGTFYMMAFGLGTIPLMSATALLGKMAKGKWLGRIRNWVPVFVVILGILFILRGMGLGIPYISPKDPSMITATHIECHP
ncbi:sulfite exporter TauE/SafE family protein [Robiginitalea sp. IMCC43444]|uniref:sulfite exporter TauE/SafE family protein n=1 Tax=Robiginitalea sp. IMCC43444 TaxID=3459121 RepID=UPI004042A7F6